jgi:hypothetical protein
MNYDYFAARSDSAAAAMLDRPGGPELSPAEREAAGLLTSVLAGVQFSQELGRLVALLGKDVDLEDGEHIVAAVDDDSGLVFRLPADVTREIAHADAARLHALVPAWAEFEDFADPDEDRLRAFADDLQRMSRTALDAGGQVYSHGWA